MQPRSREPRCKVTNAPPGFRSSWSSGRLCGLSRPSTAATIDRRAIARSKLFCGSVSEDILRLLFGLHNRPAVPLLNAGVDLAPEHLEVVDCRRDSTQYHEPHQHVSQCL